MAPHSGVLGSSPTVRSSTSQPQRGGSKGNVVPFTRRTGFGAPEKSDGSRPEGSRPEGSSVPARQRYSFDDRMCSRSPGGSLSSRSLPALRRPELVVPQTVQRGFAPPSTSARPPASSQQPRRASAGGVPAPSGTAAVAPASSAGLLTRQFSSDTVHAPGPSDLQVISFSVLLRLLKQQRPLGVVCTLLFVDPPRGLTSRHALNRTDDISFPRVSGNAAATCCASVPIVSEPVCGLLQAHQPQGAPVSMKPSRHPVAPTCAAHLQPLPALRHVLQARISSYCCRESWRSAWSSQQQRRMRVLVLSPTA
jgi:hypothetical protein